jgi:parallel beta-helix repeat protein
MAMTAPAAAAYPSTIDQDYAASLVPPGGSLVVVSTTIQAAVDAAFTGDVVFVPPGHYAENVAVRTPGLTLVGPHDAVLDGSGLAGGNGIDVRPTDPAALLAGFDLVGFSIRNYSRNGIFLRGVDNYSVTSGEYVNNDRYGVFPVRSTNGLIADNEVSGSNDTGIYVGQSVGAVIRDNHALDNTIGIAVENTLDTHVIDNLVENNSLGLVAVVLPVLSIKETTNVQVTGNTFANNNRPNPVVDPGEFASVLPAGVGALFTGTNFALASNNVITGNGSIGMGLFSQLPDIAALDPEIDAVPDFNRFIANTVTGNGLSPDPKLALLGLPPADIEWDGTGTGNFFLGNRYDTSFPDELPTPEPSTLLLLGLGVIAVGEMRQTRFGNYKTS